MTAMWPNLTGLQLSRQEGCEGSTWVMPEPAQDAPVAEVSTGETEEN